MKTHDQIYKKVMELSADHDRIYSKMSTVKPYGDDWKAMFEECKKIAAMMYALNWANGATKEITLKF